MNVGWKPFTLANKKIFIIVFIPDPVFINIWPFLELAAVVEIIVLRLDVYSLQSADSIYRWIIQWD